MLQRVVFVAVRLTVVLVVLVIVIVIRVPVPMRVLNPVEVFVHVKVELVSFVGHVHYRSFCSFAPAALSSRAPVAERQVLKRSAP